MAPELDGLSMRSPRRRAWELCTFAVSLSTLGLAAACSGTAGSDAAGLLPAQAVPSDGSSLAPAQMHSVPGTAAAVDTGVIVVVVPEPAAVAQPETTGVTAPGEVSETAVPTEVAEPVRDPMIPLMTNIAEPEESPSDTVVSSGPAEVPAPPAASPPMDPGVEGRVPAFVAQGNLGRTMLSCDGGRSWVANRSDDDDVTCQRDFDCTHHGGAAKGLAYGGGYFYATFGWGAIGSVRRSANGVDWETTHSQSTSQLGAHQAVGGIAYFNDTLILARGSFADHFISTDQGATWVASETPGDQILRTTLRRAGYSRADGGRLVLIGDTNAEFFVSADNGRTFARPRTLPSDCGSDVFIEGGIVSNDERIVVVGQNGNACASTDGGETWASGNVGRAISSKLVWNGESFVVYDDQTQYYSEDGLDWQSRTANLPSRLSALAFGNGVYVATAHYADYADQRMFYSEDGLSWMEAGNYPTGHIIEHIGFGSVVPSSACPSP